MVARLPPINHLPCPETACYQVVEKDGVRCVSYAVRESGEALWGAFATIVDGDLIIGEVELSGAYKDPRVAVLDARRHLAGGIRKELLGAQSDGRVRT